ncbi:hypothetical protein [Enterobacter hormaechei]|uniref:hypothetical protein n=1 Tax=Enterobacter hormaechei TaxID=158836 RepID=UPI0020B804C2|nr:hypothetical protein [Enterobacter hormaechei]UTI09393.1 hypothetical protein LZ581_23000 [Enterobacter hormaechei subsp. steigerwaltii]HCD7580254.1 hypothetical protein [Escherichia coli]
MKHLTAESFFKLDWFIFKIEHYSPPLNPAQMQENDMALGYIWFQVRNEITENDDEELKMHCCFPWVASVIKKEDSLCIDVTTELDDCWLFCHQFVFPSDDKPQHAEFLSYFDSLEWREAVRKSVFIS